jgi:hypothetical protein
VRPWHCGGGTRPRLWLGLAALALKSAQRCFQVSRIGILREVINDCALSTREHTIADLKVEGQAVVHDGGRLQADVILQNPNLKLKCSAQLLRSRGGSDDVLRLEQQGACIAAERVHVYDYALMPSMRRAREAEGRQGRGVGGGGQRWETAL